MEQTYNIIGLMSGTSLDGLDMAFCRFTFCDGHWNYQVLKSDTLKYPSSLAALLVEAPYQTAEELVLTDYKFASYMAECVCDFISHQAVKPDYIASHGQTIFHQPALGITTQIGSGAVLAARTGIPVICDFRTTDVALGGQGAPLVPIGDEMLFAEYDACLNLGGFSNISFREHGQRVAFDISPCNMALNELAMQKGFPFDCHGEIASQGHVDKALLEKLNALPYYAMIGSKSLGREWYEKEFFPLLKNSALSVDDQLRTVVEHIAIQLSSVIRRIEGHRVLVTGGGAKNLFLVQRIRSHCEQLLVVPDEETIDYKEAIIFAFLGLLRVRGEVNCLSAVTGATKDSCGGCIYLP